MIVLLLPLAGGMAAGLAAWLALERLLDQPLLTRTNYRGAGVPVAGGVVLVVAVVAVGAVHAACRAALLISDANGARSLDRTVLAVLGFGFLGLLDDLVGGTSDPGARGLAGHGRALRHGHVTTGVLKLVGGILVAAVAVGSAERAGIDGWLRDVALVAAAANLANLLDRAPGRTLKVALVAVAVLVVAAAEPALVTGPVVVAGAGAALLVPDLRERLMLGDSGANPIGAAVGVGVVLTCSPATRLVVLVVLVVLTVLSDRVSFTSVINRTPPLRALDRVGRVRREGEHRR